MDTNNNQACRYCDTTIYKMVLPRKLPCGHISCEKCLDKQVKAEGVIRCGACGEKVLTSTLPSALPLDYGPECSCGPCLRKNASCRATHYCLDCDMIMCSEHVEAHNEVSDHLNVVELNGDTSFRRKQASATYKCPVHKEEKVVRGCSHCYKALCLLCLDESFSCDSGNLHSLKSLDEVALLVKKELEDITHEIAEKTDAVIGLKDVTKNERGFVEKQFKQAMGDLQLARDDHFERLRKKYQKLEDEIAAAYREVETNLVSYQDDKLTETLDSLVALIAEMGKLNLTPNKVDLLTGFNGMRERIVYCQNTSIPTIKLPVSLAIETDDQESTLCVKRSENETVINISDRSRPKGTFQFRIEDVSKVESRLISPDYYVGDVPWCIMVQPEYNDSKKKFLGFYIQCNLVTDTKTWVCRANASMKLLRQSVEGKDPLVRSFEQQRRFHEKEKSWGFRLFIGWNEMLEPSHGFVKDDSVLLEAVIAVGKASE